MPAEEYLGDGVYASFDGIQVWLRADRDGRSHMVALEPEAYRALVNYHDRLYGIAPHE